MSSFVDTLHAIEYGNGASGSGGGGGEDSECEPGSAAAALALTTPATVDANISPSTPPNPPPSRSSVRRARLVNSFFNASRRDRESILELVFADIVEQMSVAATRLPARRHALMRTRGAHFVSFSSFTQLVATMPVDERDHEIETEGQQQQQHDAQKHIVSIFRSLADPDLSLHLRNAHEMTRKVMRTYDPKKDMVWHLTCTVDSSKSFHSLAVVNLQSNDARHHHTPSLRTYAIASALRGYDASVIAAAAAKELARRLAVAPPPPPPLPATTHSPSGLALRPPATAVVSASEKRRAARKRAAKRVADLMRAHPSLDQFAILCEENQAIVPGEC